MATDDAKLLLVLSLPDYLKQTIDGRLHILIGPKPNDWMDLDKVALPTLRCLLNNNSKIASFSSVRR